MSPLQGKCSYARCDRLSQPVSPNTYPIRAQLRSPPRITVRPDTYRMNPVLVAIASQDNCQSRQLSDKLATNPTGDRLSQTVRTDTYPQ
ncbi:MAG: hypothetical protein ACRCU2_02150 [Planktothrix sp.]